MSNKQFMTVKSEAEKNQKKVFLPSEWYLGIGILEDDL